MSKMKKFVLFALSALMCVSMLTACNPTISPSGNISFSGEAIGAKMSFENGLVGKDSLDYNGDLFYFNELRTSAADPHAIYISYENITETYDKFVQNYQYLDENGNYSWIDGWSQERFDAENGTKDEWISHYSNKYYMTNTDGGGGLTAADAAKYNCSDAIFPIYESPDLCNWYKVGKVSGAAIAANKSQEWHDSSFWAPELYRDPATGLYFIYYSASCKNGNSNTTYFPTGIYGNSSYIVSCAVSNAPDGPYYPITSAEYYAFRAAKDKTGAVLQGSELKNGPDLNRDGSPDYGYYEIYDRDAKTVIGYKNGNKYYTPAGYEITNQTPAMNVAYYYPRIASDKEKVKQFEDRAHITKFNGYKNSNIDICMFTAIDVHMYDDPVSGKMYMYFSNTNGRFTDYTGFYGNIWGVEMLDAITPNWDTLTHLTMPGYSVIKNDGTFFGQNGPNGEDEGAVNEGPEVVYHNGKYYLTYSPWGYTSRRYAIQVATSDSPLGEFQKAGTEYTPVIGVGTEYNNYMSGTGHHCFIMVGDELFTLYHAFANAENNYDNSNNFLGRMLAIDRVFFKYEENLGYDMMFANGPSYNLQPKPESYTGYTDVGKFAKIEANGDVGQTEYLNDGMFTAHPTARKYEYGKTSGKLIIKFSWDQPVTIRALQVYNSGGIYNAFKGIDLIQFKLAEKPAWYNLDRYNEYVYIENVMCDPNDYLEEYNIMRKGGSAVAEFAPITVTEMYICINADVNNKYVSYDEAFTQMDYSEIHVSEVYIYGNKTEANA